MNEGWNPWKVTAIGLAVVMVTAVVTGLVVASWTGSPAQRQSSVPSAPAAVAKLTTATPSASPRASTPATSTPSAPAPTRPAVPSEATIATCNRVAAGAPTTKDKTVEIVKDSAIAAAVGAAVGAAGGAIADGGKGAGKGAAIGGVLGAGAGALYGVNENRKNDERYREAYAACMRARGYGV